MKIKNKSPKKKIIASFVATTLIVGGLLAYYVLASQNNSDDQKQTNSSKEDTVNRPVSNNKSDSQDFRNSDNSDEATSTTPEDTGVIIDDNGTPRRDSQYTGQTNVTISRAEADEATLTITALVQGGESGNCNIRVTNHSAEKAFSSPIQAGPSYFACQVETPRNQFSSGVWQVFVTVNNSTAQTEVRL